MTNGEIKAEKQPTETEGSSAEAKLAELIGGVNQALQGFVSQQEQIAGALGELKDTVAELGSKRSTEREKAIGAVKTAVWVAIGVMTAGFGAFLFALAWLEWRHVRSNAAAAVSHAVTGAGSTALTLTNVHWPVSALGWAGAIGFLGFAICIAAIVVAIAASLSRLTGQDF